MTLAPDQSIAECVGTDGRALADFYRCPIAPGILAHPLPEGRASVSVSETLENLRRERYAVNGYRGKRPVLSSGPVQQAYYCVRPLLPIGVRRRIQQFFLRDWRTLPFPSWPVDTTVEQILERLLVTYMQDRKLDAVPFIWFWPDGASGCVMLTHDVETAAGAEFVPLLVDLDDAFGFKAAFLIIPEKQYRVSPELLQLIRSRGCEVNVQDLCHDGNLFDDHGKFLQRAPSINGYLKQYRTSGFRSGRLYRNADWLEALEIEYDMSVPNVAHLESQRGGCCTVFPYFIGNILELPLTTVQDYSLFHVLGDYSIGLWKEQLAIITARHGLASFIVHPDYVRRPRALAVYRQLLQFLSAERAERNLWAALPQDVNRWWRQRSRMTLECDNGQWVIRGAGSERARIAWARMANGRVSYSFE